MTELGQEGGKTQVMVARRMPNGHIIMGFFLVDLWCLGVKDCFFRIDVPLGEYKDYISQMETRVDLKLVEPAIAFDTVYAAVEYAEDLGFEPTKDFNMGQYLLDDPDTLEYIEIETGLNGKPTYCPGPDDKVEAVLKKLNQKVGKGNYVFYDFDNFDDAEDVGHSISKHQIIQTYFPDDKVEKKLNTLSDENTKTVFMLQTVIASLALGMASGSMPRLLELLEEDEFVDELMDVVMEATNEMREMEGLPALDTNKSSSTESLTQLMVDRIKRHGSVDFMFEENYTPLPDVSKLKNPSNLTPEELEIYVEEAFTMLEEDDKLLIELWPTFLQATENRLGTNFAAADVTGEVRTQIIKDVKVKLQENEELAEIMGYVENLEDFLEMKFDKAINSYHEK